MKRRIFGHLIGIDHFCDFYTRNFVYNKSAKSILRIKLFSSIPKKDSMFLFQGMIEHCLSYVNITYMDHCVPIFANCILRTRLFYPRPCSTHFSFPPDSLFLPFLFHAKSKHRVENNSPKFLVPREIILS